jgi:hypothetical protein
MHKFEIQGYEKILSKQSSLTSQENSQLTGSTVMLAKKLDIKLSAPRSTTNAVSPANSNPSENPVNPVNPEVPVSQRRVDYENKIKEIEPLTKPRFK